MKDLSSVLFEPDSSSRPTSPLQPLHQTTSEDDYVFTEDQRRAALELQSLYRKLGLEDLDDGFEEGLSAYDDPQFDIVARLHEVNTRFEADETPLESERQRKVRFKEILVDLVVPISPVRCSLTPPDLEYADYDDDDYDDDFESEELHEIMAQEEIVEVNQNDSSPSQTDDSVIAKSWLPSSTVDAVEPSAPPLSDFHSEDGKVNGVDDDDDDDEHIHIRQIGIIELEEVTDSDRSNCSSPEKMLKLETDDCQFSNAEQIRVQGVSENLDNTKASTEVNNNPIVSNPPDEIKVEPAKQLQVAKTEENLLSSSINENNNNKENQASNDRRCLSVKPKKPFRTGSPPFKTRSAPKKTSLQKPLSSSDEYPNQNSVSTKSGNPRSRYGLTEELRQELKRLKQMEIAQKKMREQEQAEEKRRRQEEAESAFRAWLEMKKTKPKSCPASVTPPACRSPTRKVERALFKDQERNDVRDEAFKAWLERKQEQQGRERLLRQLQEQQEASADTHKSRDSSRKAYRLWLQRKNVQKRPQRSQQGGLMAATYPPNIPRALQHAQMINRTYQAYFGSSLWAALAGIKGHPAKQL